jgi:4-amino-4-deoxy-L-arabinose transferase-like glycosyltransferase
VLKDAMKQFLAKYKWLILVLLIGIVVRTYDFGNIPPGLHADEASVGYDSYAVLNYGIDRNGFHNPVIFNAYGQGMNSLYQYLSMPFIAVFSLNTFSVRLLSLLLGILSLFLFYILVKDVSDEKTALVSAFLLAISPWHIITSRWGMEENIFYAIFLIGALFLVRSFKNKNYLPFSSFFFALVLYTHNSAYFVVPIFVTISSTYILIHKKVNIKTFLVSTFIFLIVAMPVFTYLVINIYKLDSVETSFFSIPHLTGAPRFKASTLFNGNLIRDLPGNFDAFVNLMVKQDDYRYLNIWNIIPPYGFIYLFSIPFMIIGLSAIIFKNRKLSEFNKEFFVLLWFFVSVALAMLVSPLTINRLNIIFPPIIFFIASGIIWLKENLKINVFLIIIPLYLASFASFTEYYFNSFPEQAGNAPFYDSFGEAINYASESTNGSICITGHTAAQPYIFVLFYQKIDPNIFVRTVNYIDRGADFEHVLSFDRYDFFLNCRNNTKAYLVHNSEMNKFNQTQLSYLVSKGKISVKELKNFSVLIKNT